MKLNKNYTQFHIIEIVQVLSARFYTFISSKLQSFCQRWIELDQFIRLANLNGLKIVRNGGTFMISSHSNPNVISHSIKLRQGSSDFAVYTSSILGDDYQGLNELLLGQENTVNFIVDAGANIGTTSLIFSRKYPKAQVLGLEADKDNFDLYVFNMNINNCDNVVPRHAALWGSHEAISISTSGREWAHDVKPSRELRANSHSVDSLTISDLICMAPNGLVDILKVDIEGAEENVFLGGLDLQKENELMKHVRYIAIEIHGPILDLKIKTLLRKIGYSLFQTGETTYARNLRFDSGRS